jgi:glycosyltransferase involved in cell wall biosynthesis
MKISVITPVYNAEKTIEKTILSVINQNTDSEIEYIIIDGGSSDNTLSIIKQYNDYIKILISEKDQGVYDAMNKGISLATGDIIGIINSDDWYNKTALSLVEKAFIKYPDISIIHSPVTNYIGEKIVSTFMPGELNYLPFKFTIAHPSCFVKKEVYQKIGSFNLDYSMAADYDFILRAYGNQLKFHCIDNPLASFSLNGMTGTWKNRLRLIQESWECTGNFVSKYQQDIKIKHHLYYVTRFLRELALIPLKRIDPHIVIKVKGMMRKYFGKLPSDKYGAW